MFLSVNIYVNRCKQKSILPSAQFEATSDAREGAMTWAEVLRLPSKSKRRTNCRPLSLLHPPRFNSEEVFRVSSLFCWYELSFLFVSIILKFCACSPMLLVDEFSNNEINYKYSVMKLLTPEISSNYGPNHDSFFVIATRFQRSTTNTGPVGEQRGRFEHVKWTDFDRTLATVC